MKTAPSFQKYLLLLFLFSGAQKAFGQDTLRTDAAGKKLESFYLSMNVETLWIAHTHVNWQTGSPDEPNAKQGVATHCSAFVAAACQRLGIYILRPPEHGQVLLANAQADWLNSETGARAGWMQIPDSGALFLKVQLLANKGKIVVAVYKNSISRKPGHIALIMPAEKTQQLLANEGPDLIMASTHNYNRISLIKGFRSHITSWPTHDVAFYVYGN